MLTINEDGFKKYGQVIEQDVDEIIAYLKGLELPAEGNKYVASDEAFEKLGQVKVLEKHYFGNKRMEAGYVIGHNVMLNCEEYHCCIEINVASDDCTLFLGTLDQIKNGQLDTSSLEEVLVRKGEAFLLYPGTLHFSPCAASKDGFRVAVLLTKGTNTPLDEKGDDPRLWMKNKWLIAHKDTVQASKGAYVGLVGQNRKGSLAK